MIEKAYFFHSLLTVRKYSFKGRDSRKEACMLSANLPCLYSHAATHNTIESRGHRLPLFSNHHIQSILGWVRTSSTATSNAHNACHCRSALRCL